MVVCNLAGKTKSQNEKDYSLLTVSRLTEQRGTKPPKTVRKSLFSVSVRAKYGFRIFLSFVPALLSVIPSRKTVNRMIGWLPLVFLADFFGCLVFVRLKILVCFCTSRSMFSSMRGFGKLTSHQIREKRANPSTASDCRSSCLSSECDLEEALVQALKVLLRCEDTGNKVERIFTLTSVSCTDVENNNRTNRMLQLDHLLIHFWYLNGFLDGHAGNCLAGLSCSCLWSLN